MCKVGYMEILKCFWQKLKNRKKRDFMLQEIKSVFSKGYQENVRFLELKNSMRQYIKLRNESESIDAKIERLKTMGYISNCHIKVGEF